MATLDKTLECFLEQPEKYILCHRELLRDVLRRDSRVIDYPNHASIYADVLNNQIFSVEQACIQDGALKIKHFAVSISEDFDDFKNVDLRRRGVGRSMMRGLARILGPARNIHFIDFDLSFVKGRGGAEAYAQFTDGLGAIPYGDLRRLPIAPLLA